MKKGAIYEIPCMDCDAMYMYTGETGRCLNKRVEEHQKDVKNCDRSSVHAWNESGMGGLGGSQSQGQDLWKRKVLEAIHMKLQTPDQLQQSGL